MLHEAAQRGVQDALDRFQIKEAASVRGVLGGASNFLVGEAPRVLRAARTGTLGNLFRKGRKATTPGGRDVAPGALNIGQVLWPTFKGRPFKQWTQRAFTALPAIGAIQAARGKAGDPNESRLTNTLGAMGTAAGYMYGYPAAGMLGAPILAGLGHRVGTGVGRLFGNGRPPVPPPQPAPPRQMPQPFESPPTGGPQYGGPYYPGVR